MKLLSKLWQFVNKDLTGREEVLESSHPYFGKVIFFGRKGYRGYWEAELAHPDLTKKFSVLIPTGKDGAMEPYANFTSSLLKDLDGLFARCKPEFMFEYQKWSNEPFPPDWRRSFVLDGITLPEETDEIEEWSVCYFVEPANHYFTAVFQGGKVREVIVDG